MVHMKFYIIFFLLCLFNYLSTNELEEKINSDSNGENKREKIDLKLLRDNSETNSKTSEGMQDRQTESNSDDTTNKNIENDEESDEMEIDEANDSLEKLSRELDSLEVQSEEISKLVKGAVNGISKKIEDLEKKVSSKNYNQETTDLGKDFSKSQDEELNETDKPEVPETDPKLLTPEYQKAEKLFQEGIKVLNVSGIRKRRMQTAYSFFQQAAEYNHTGALEYMAMGSLLGDGVSQSLVRARALFSQLAEDGNPRGQFGLGFMHATGLMALLTPDLSLQGDVVNSTENGPPAAVLFLTFAALGDDNLAQMAVGYRYYQGLGVDINCEQSLAFYRRVAGTVMEAINAGSGGVGGGPKTGGVHRLHLIEEAEANTGIYGNAGTTSPTQTLLDDDLLHYYHFLAEKGDINAQVGLGHLYLEGGRGVNIDYEKAFYYLKQASDHGNTNAMAYLGQMYLEGSEVVTANNQTAFEYFKKSADLGSSMGMSGLGLMYLHGRGVERDYERAFKYFSMSTQHGLVDGQLHLGIMYLKGLGLRTDYKTAKKYFELAAQQGNIVAIYNLALMYGYGTGVVRSCTTATELFKNVAERGRWSVALMEAYRSYKQKHYKESYVKYLLLSEIGYEVAQSNVAFMLEQGLVKLMTKEQSLKRAFMMLHRSATQGYVLSRVKLGDAYYYGLGTNVDYEKSAYHYRLASESQHNPQAMFNLGYMHENGLGVNKDIHLAKRFYDMAESVSADAQLPVKLALTKLQFHFFMESFSLSDWSSSMVNFVNPQVVMGPMWDLYIVAGLIGLLTVLVFLYQNNRRLLLIHGHNQRQPAPNPPPAQAAPNPAEPRAL